MPILAWAAGPAAKSASLPATMVVMASEFQLNSFWRVPGFMKDSIAIRGSALQAEGLIGISLEANPMGHTFRTLSGWIDRRTLDEFVKSEPHRSVMAKQRPHTKASLFTFWDAPADTPPSWDDALLRLSEASKSKD